MFDRKWKKNLLKYCDNILDYDVDESNKFSVMSNDSEWCNSHPTIKKALQVSFSIEKEKCL
jgi:hypothetical protein